MRGGRSTSGACHAGRAMKAAPDLHKKRAERGGRKREGGESERRAGKGTTTQPSAGGTAQSTDLRRCTPLQDQYAKAHRRSRSKAAHPPARFGPAASPGALAEPQRPAEVAPTFVWFVQGGRVLPSRSWSRGAEGSAAPRPLFWFPDYLGMHRGQWTKKHEQKVRIRMCPQVTETPTESVVCCSAHSRALQEEGAS